jgi:hypothetical protein
VGHNGEPSKLDCFLEDVQLKWCPSAGGFVFASQVVLSITTGILRLLYVISLEFAALAAVGCLVRLAVRALVRWYHGAVARTNEYWATRNPVVREGRRTGAELSALRLPASRSWSDLVSVLNGC